MVNTQEDCTTENQKNIFNTEQAGIWIFWFPKRLQHQI